MWGVNQTKLGKKCNFFAKINLLERKDSLTTLLHAFRIQLRGGKKQLIFAVFRRRGTDLHRIAGELPTVFKTVTCTRKFPSPSIIIPHGFGCLSLLF
jgi:hypothetical protein